MPLGMIGKYEKLDVLGHGASGIVYLAKDSLLNRQVAIKVVNLEAGEVRHFLEEARVLDRLRHPNIVRVHNVDRIDGNIVLDMEYVRGKNVQEMLREQTVLPQEYALEIAAQTLEALQYAHEMQTVHRDIKPANILISRDGEVKLVDFGLAEILATNSYAGGAGTYAYMAPEDFADENRSDHQSDIWAVGVTLYEMLAGQRPFLVSRPKDPFAWKRVLDNEQPTPLISYLSTATDDLQSILTRALAREKSRRYGSAAAFRDDIRLLQSGKSLSRFARTAAAPRPLRQTALASGSAAPSSSTRRRIALTPDAGIAVDGRDSATAAATRIAEQTVLPDVTARPASTQPASDVPSLLSANPDRVSFGAVRRNEIRETRLHVRAGNIQGPVSGRVIHAPEWLSVRPIVFDRPRQVFSLAAHGDKTGGLGDIAGALRVEIAGDTVDIPVRARIVAARPAFVHVAAWFVPLFATAVLPVAAVLYASGAAHASPEAVAQYVPAAAAATGLLSTMLLLIAFAADIGLAERIACGVVSLAMGAVLGVSSAHWQRGVLGAGALHTLLTGVPLGGMLCLQLLSVRRWRWWAIIAACTGAAIGGGFYNQLR